MKKYTLYAIGEVLLVMIGILLALQVNNWNEQRKTRVEEKIILTEIGENLKSSIDVLEGIEEHIEYHSNKIQLLIRHMKYDLPYHDSLDVFFYNIQSFRTPQFPSSGYETLESRGIGILSNQELRKSIIETFNHILPEVTENFKYDGRMRHEEFHNSVYLDHFKILSEDHDDKLIFAEEYLGNRSSAKPNNYQILIQDDRYENFLRSIFDNNKWFAIYANGTKKDLTELLSEVEEELSQH